MFDTPEEISRYNFINNLVDEVDKYGLVGCYFNYTKSENPINNGIYFVCGYNADTVMNKNNNLEKMYYDQQHDEARTRLDLYVMRITDNSPYAVHQAIISYALHASTMKGIMNYTDFPKMLTCVQKSFVSTAEMIYVNATDKALPLLERERYRKTLQKFMNEQGMKQYKSNGLDVENADKTLESEKITRKSPPNMVSLKSLLYSSSDVSKIVVQNGHLEPFERELNKDPRFKYWRSQTVETSLGVPDNQGYGSHILNNPKETTFMFNRKYRKEIVGLYIKTMFPEAAKYSTTDIINMGYGTCSVGVSLNSLADIFKKAEKLRCPVAIDYKKLFFNCSKGGLKDHTGEDGLLTLRIPNKKEYVKAMDDILWSNRNELLKTRILTPEDERDYAHKMYGHNSWDVAKENFEEER